MTKVISGQSRSRLCSLKYYYFLSLVIHALSDQQYYSICVVCEKLPLKYFNNVLTN